MAIAVTFPDSVEVGETVAITGTGFTSAGTVKFDAKHEEGGFSVSAVVTLGVTTNLDSAGLFDLIPQEAGHVDITVTDVTAVESQTGRVEVFQS